MLRGDGARDPIALGRAQGALDLLETLEDLPRKLAAELEDDKENPVR